MSLVEQAIARMKNQVGAGKHKSANSTKPDAPTPIVKNIPESTKVTKRITFDAVAMRAGGYLPEDGKDRQFADHYRRIKRPLIDKALSGTVAMGEAHVIMVTSALPGDGKTFTSINLALSMALERDVSVLLIDCDVAKRHVSEILGMKEETGLLDALVDESIDVESLVAQTNMKGLSVLPAGRRVESTAELLSSNRMRQIVKDLCERNPRQILLLDTAPLLVTSEGRTLVKFAGQVVLVVRAGQTPRQAVRDAVGLFDPRQAGGVILNHVATAGDQGYYGYGSYGTYGANETTDET
jgi:exopolysaccharide/PEP-CTERM locus tyrosine autokinase